MMTAAAEARRPFFFCAVSLMAWLATPAPAAAPDPPPILDQTAGVNTTESEYLVDVWGTDEGLPNNTVTSILQTPDGFLWCGTYDGVVRFDGVRFVRIGPDEPNHPATRVHCLHLDRQGDLWIGTDGGGVLRYVSGKFARVVDSTGTPANAVRAISADEAGNLWLGTQGGLGRWQNGKVSWFTETTGYTNASRSIWNLAFDPDGKLWIADWSTLKAFKDGQFESAEMQPELKPPVRAIYADRAGNLCAGMSGWALRRAADGTWNSIASPGQFGNAEVVAFCQTRSGDFWVGTRRGLYRQRDGRWSEFNERDGLISSEVRALFEDQDGNLWIGTGTAGLARLKRRVLKTYLARDGLTDGAVLALRERPNGGLWVGLNDGRLLAGTPGRFQTSFPAENLRNDAPVKSVLATRDGALWVGTFGNGLFRLEHGTNTQFVPSVGSPARIDKVNALLEDRDGRIWVGTFYSLYQAAEDNILTAVPVGGRELRAPVTALVESKAGGLWIACDGLGVAHLSPEKTTWLTRAQGLPTHFIRALYEDQAGALWIGTAAGLSCWRQGKITTVNRTHGLVDDVISQIVEDDFGALWLGSNRGLMKLSKPDWLAVGQGAKGLLDLAVYGRGEGMTSERCGLSPTALKTRDGKLWFPTTQGLVMADPRQLNNAEPSSPPAVYIEEVIADGRQVATPHFSFGRNPAGRTAVPVYPASTRRVEFIYTALRLTAPERLRFKYRLEGFNPDWVEAGAQRSAVFPQLPPGRYQFQVLASNNDGVWTQAGHQFAFRIATPFWRSWWFLFLCGAASVAAVGGIARVVSVRQLQGKLSRLEQAHAIEKERMRIAQDMHDEIGGKLSRISFLSDLARRNVPSSSETGRQIDDVSEAAREVIRAVDEIVWAVSPRNDTLESLAHYICRHAEEFFELTPVELELDLPTEFPDCQLSAEVRHNLFCAVKEALNNVLKHARPTRVRISFGVEPSAFHITVTDNGAGFDPADPPTEVRNGHPRRRPERRGSGLTNMHDRLERLRGKCRWETQPGAGVKVSLTVPLN